MTSSEGKDTASDEDWQAARARLREAITAFNVAVRNDMRRPRPVRNRDYQS